MPISLDGDGTGGAPVLTRTNIGERAVVAICHHEMRQRLDMDTREPMTKRDGSPVRELVVTALYVEGDMPSRLGGVDTQPAPGEEVRLILHGGAWSQWIDATKTLRDTAGRGLQVGDLVTMDTTHGDIYRYPNHIGTAETMAEVEAARAARGQQVGMRGTVSITAGTDASLIAQCEQVYQRIADRPRISLDDGPVKATPPPASAQEADDLLR